MNALNVYGPADIPHGFSDEDFRDSPVCFVIIGLRDLSKRGFERWSPFDGRWCVKAGERE